MTDYNVTFFSLMMFKLHYRSSHILMGCRLLTGAILAHELMHAWLRLNGSIFLYFDPYGIQHLSSIRDLSSHSFTLN